MDVTSLYTCISHSGGLKSLKHFLKNRANLDPPTDTVVCLAELVFKQEHSFFSWRSILEDE